MSALPKAAPSQRFAGTNDVFVDQLIEACKPSVQAGDRTLVGRALQPFDFEDASAARPSGALAKPLQDSNKRSGGKQSGRQGAEKVQRKRAPAGAAPAPAHAAPAARPTAKTPVAAHGSGRALPPAAVGFTSPKPEHVPMPTSSLLQRALSARAIAVAAA